MDPEHHGKGQPLRPIGTRLIIAMMVLASFSLVLVGTTSAHDALDGTDDHGRLMLSFEQMEDVCRVEVVASDVDVADATLRIEHRPAKDNPEVHHEEDLTGEPEADGDGFRFVAGPYDYGSEDLHDGDGFRDPGVVPLQRFILSWDDGAHSMYRDWTATGCNADPLLLIHQDETSGATHQVDGCALFVEGRHIGAEAGRLELHGVQSDLSIEMAITSDDTGPEENGDGHRFFVGPIEVPLSGNYSVHFHPGEEGAPAQGFRMVHVLGCSVEPPECPPNMEAEARPHLNVIRWDTVQDAMGYLVKRSVNGGEMALVEDVSHGVRSITLDRDVENGTTYEYLVTAYNEIGESEDCPTVMVDRTAGEGEDEDAGEAGDVCAPVALRAIANQDESLTITADGLDGTATLMRSAGGGAFEQVATLDAENDTYHDTDTEVGVTYVYQLVLDDEVCAQAEATAIPNFPSMVAGALALGLGLLSYVAVRRRD